MSTFARSQGWRHEGSISVPINLVYPKPVFTGKVKGPGAYGSSFRIGMRLDGVPKLLAMLKKIPKSVYEQVQATTVLHAHSIWRRADELVPEDKGPLRASGKILAQSSGLATPGVKTVMYTEGGMRIDKVIAAVSYGGTKAKYALPVHERTPIPRHGAAYNANVAYNSAYARFGSKKKAKAFIRKRGIMRLRRPQETALWLNQAYEERGPAFISKLTRDVRKILQQTLLKQAETKALAEKFLTKGAGQQ